jgi:hypothetical protein
MSECFLTGKKCFRHYDNRKLYWIVCEDVKDANNAGAHSEPQVVYRDLDCNTFTRSASEFYGMVASKRGEPITVPRFERLSERKTWALYRVWLAQNWMTQYAESLSRTLKKVRI